MTTWRYTNSYAATVMVTHPTVGQGNGAVLGPGEMVEFNTHSGDRASRGSVALRFRKEAVGSFRH